MKKLRQSQRYKQYLKTLKGKRLELNEFNRLRLMIYHNGVYNQKKLKLAALMNYGGDPPKCKCCGETIQEVLTINHDNGDGSIHRKTIRSGYQFYNWLRKNNYPKGYSVLCFNCNIAASRTGYCPHNPKLLLQKKVYNHKKRGLIEAANP